MGEFDEETVVRAAVGLEVGPLDEDKTEGGTVSGVGIDVLVPDGDCVRTDGLSVADVGSSVVP